MAQIFIRRSLFGGACLFALLVVSTVKSAADCKPELVAMNQLSGPAQSDAENVTRHNWEFAASQKYGVAYSHWNKATDRKIECEKQAGGYQCWATARPCN
jgi:hypothetical protein